MCIISLVSVRNPYKILGDPHWAGDRGRARRVGVGVGGVGGV